MVLDHLKGIVAEMRIDVGSDYNAIWMKLKLDGIPEKRKLIRYKWSVDGRSDWVEYRHAVEDQFKGWWG